MDFLVMDTKSYINGITKSMSDWLTVYTGALLVEVEVGVTFVVSIGGGVVGKPRFAILLAEIPNLLSTILSPASKSCLLV
jgi:hypothetical protein